MIIIMIIHFSSIISVVLFVLLKKYTFVLAAAETESHPSIKMEEDLSIATKLNSFENEVNNSKISQEVSENIINFSNFNFLNKRLYYIHICYNISLLIYHVIRIICRIQIWSKMKGWMMCLIKLMKSLKSSLKSANLLPRYPRRHRIKF